MVEYKGKEIFEVEDNSGSTQYAWKMNKRHGDYCHYARSLSEAKRYIDILTKERGWEVYTIGAGHNCYEESRIYESKDYFLLEEIEMGQTKEVQLFAEHQGFDGIKFFQ